MPLRKGDTVSDRVARELADRRAREQAQAREAAILREIERIEDGRCLFSRFTDDALRVLRVKQALQRHG